MGSTDDVVGLVSIGQLAKAAGVSSRTVLRNCATACTIRPPGPGRSTCAPWVRPSRPVCSL